jgi:hypothetical protein
MDIDEARSQLDAIEARLADEPFVVHAQVARNGRIVLNSALGKWGAWDADPVVTPDDAA